MKVYLWEIPDIFPMKLVGEYQKETSPDRFLFRNGCPLSPDIGTPLITFSVPPEHLLQYDVLPNDSMLPLVSERAAKHLIKHWSEDIQLIDTRVVANGRSVAGYKLLNITKLLSCIDHDESDYVLFGNCDHIMKFNRLRLKPECMAGYNLAREKEYKSYIYVTNDVKEAFETNGWKGCQFSPPESIHP